jgi:hypothetical protein
MKWLFLAGLCISTCASESAMHMRSKSNPLPNVLPLNSVTFGGNILKSQYVKHWIVSYCVPWLEQCVALEQEFEKLASTEQQARNDQFIMLSTTVRFAQVDCAKDKPLCNAMDIDTYPVVVHYHDHRQSKWSGGYGRTARSSTPTKMSLESWISTRLDEGSANVEATSLPAAAWLLKKETRNLLGGLAAVCVVVFSIWALLDQLWQLAKLHTESLEKEMSSELPVDEPLLQPIAAPASLEL